MITDEQYKIASGKIDNAHSGDISSVTENGIELPCELLYSMRMVQVLELFNPGSTYVLKLAVQCQHLQRWGIPRADFPFDRRGYHEWRRVVMDYQLNITSLILTETGINEADILLVSDTLKNQGNKSHIEAQIIMDIACLVFLKWYMEPFASKHQNEKVMDIMKKTIRKMSQEAVTIIPKLDLPESAQLILNMAIH